MVRVGIFLGCVWLTARTMHPHGAYVRGANRNRSEPRWGGIERDTTRTRTRGSQALHAVTHAEMLGCWPDANGMYPAAQDPLRRTVNPRDCTGFSARLALPVLVGSVGLRRSHPVSASGAPITPCSPPYLKGAVTHHEG